MTNDRPEECGALQAFSVGKPAWNRGGRLQQIHEKCRMDIDILHKVHYNDRAFEPTESMNDSRIHISCERGM
jgi:hypothetical protein